MKTIIITKRNKLLLGLTAILVTGALLFSCCNNIELLGEAQIMVYEKGEKTILDPRSPYFQELQAACEEMLTSAESLYYFPIQIDDPPEPEELKRKEWVMEIIYRKPIEVYMFIGGGPTASINVPVEVSQYLIPLTGEWSHIKAEGVKSFDQGIMEYSCLFFSSEITYFKFSWDGLIGTIKDVQEIKDILTRFDINVP